MNLNIQACNIYIISDVMILKMSFIFVIFNQTDNIKQNFHRNNEEM